MSDRERLVSERLRQQRIVTWLILVIGIASFVFILGVVIMVWSVIL